MLSPGSGLATVAMGEDPRERTRMTMTKTFTDTHQKLCSAETGLEPNGWTFPTGK